MFNKQFYIDKINSEIQHQLDLQKENDEYLSSLPKLSTIPKNTEQYKVLTRDKMKHFRRRRSIYDKILRLEEELERYRNYDI